MKCLLGILIVTGCCACGVAFGAAFSAAECGDISACCAMYDNSDDSDLMEEECCGIYGGDNHLACWEVCIRGESSQYCEDESGGYICSAGYGYNEIKDICEVCGSGTYSRIASWAGINDYKCMTCPEYYDMAGNTILVTSGRLADDITDCFIADDTQMQFSDASGRGTYNFQYNCYYKK